VKQKRNWTTVSIFSPITSTILLRAGYPIAVWLFVAPTSIRFITFQIAYYEQAKELGKLKTTDTKSE
jgi:hypothetical protein